LFYCANTLQLTHPRASVRYREIKKSTPNQTSLGFYELLQRAKHNLEQKLRVEGVDATSVARKMQADALEQATAASAAIAAAAAAAAAGNSSSSSGMHDSSSSSSGGGGGLSMGAVPVGVGIGGVTDSQQQQELGLGYAMGGSDVAPLPQAPPMMAGAPGSAAAAAAAAAAASAAVSCVAADTAPLVFSTVEHHSRFQ
jgi:hypothetical protein